MALSSKKAKDHWAFLEEIEAPMWADLLVEAKSNYQETNDGWFNASHRFHQCSSKELKAMFSQGVGSTSTDFEWNRPSSPKLPSSVSRSRGKHYSDKKWRGKENGLLFDEQHPVEGLTTKPSTSDLGSRKKMKAKVSFVDSKGSSRSDLSSVSGTDLVENESRRKYSASSSSSVAYKEDESNVNAIACESSTTANQNKIEVSSGSFNSKTALLSAVKISLRKSCMIGTRKASRVEISHNGRQTRDRKSSSGNSSVGSSLTPGCDLKGQRNTSVQKKDHISNDRNVLKMTESAKNKLKVPNNVKVSSVTTKNGNHNSVKHGLNKITNSTHKEDAKVRKQNVRIKALMSHVGNKPCSSGAAEPKAKVGIVQTNRSMGVSKENLVGKTFSTRKPTGGDKEAKGHMEMKHKASVKNDRTVPVTSKGKVTSTSRRQNAVTMMQRTYFR